MKDSVNNRFKYLLIIGFFFENNKQHLCRLRTQDAIHLGI